MDILNILLIILFTPLASSLVIILIGRERKKWAPWIALLGSITILGATAALFLVFKDFSYKVSWEWLSFGQHTFYLGFVFDNIGATMLAMVSVVSLCITIFSTGYMSDDPAKGRYFSGLSFFMFSMLGIILSSNLIMIFLFWELVGFSSYLLIGHYFEKNEARQASLKAFIVNRVGDFGFLIGIILTYWQFGTTNIEAIALADGLDASLISPLIGGLLICGFIGKSAQFPLHVWLPDAMAGPTPVSALIHAATMVAAGIYLLIRIDCLLSVEVLSFIACLGTFVAVYAGFCAFAQKDIKRILAYSTLSQLGYMAAIFGLGYSGIALFHLITHAFFKALLFLGAGAVIHACHHEQSIDKMGGLFRKMPITASSFIIGTLALCGVYGLSGFYSKDAILIAAHDANFQLFLLLILGAFLTAGYMGRLIWTVFFGKANSENADHAHEVNPLMSGPLIILSIFAVVVGLNQYWPFGLGEIVSLDLDHLDHLEHYKSMHKTVLIWGSLAWVVGLAGSLLFYGKGSKSDRLEKNAPKVYAFLEGRLWMDELYAFYVNKIQQRAANFLSFLDDIILRGLIIRGGAGLLGIVGVGLRILQVGRLNAYYLWFFVGLILLWFYAAS